MLLADELIGATANLRAEAAHLDAQMQLQAWTTPPQSPMTSNCGRADLATIPHRCLQRAHHGTSRGVGVRGHGVIDPRFVRLAVTEQVGPWISTMAGPDPAIRNAQW
jgi:hypothetical protein